MENYKDWSHNIYFQCSDTNPSLEACGVPFSCCIHLQNQVRASTLCDITQRSLKGLDTDAVVAAIFAAHTRLPVDPNMGKEVELSKKEQVHAAARFSSLVT